MSLPPDPVPPPTTGPPSAPDEPKPAPKRGPVAAFLAAGAALLLKFKGLLALLKFASLGKLLLSGSSMFLYLWFQASRYGWKFAAGFVVLLFLHEMGHAVAIRKYGLKAGWPLFIPGFGALISMKEPAPSRGIDAEISFGGPLWGTIASFAVLSMYFVTRSPFWLALGYSGLFLNMFNLTPVRPLDGGAIAEMFSRKAWILGAIILVGLLLTAPASPALIMLMFMLPRAFARRNQELAPLEPGEARTWAVRYFGLMAFMGLGMFFANMLMHPEASLASR